MRVIAGVARGHRLVAPKDAQTRPISDKAKESLFGMLGERVVEARFLDLYAGSGAIGIEALSRGAAHATFVERARPAAAVIRENLARTGLAGAATIETRAVEPFLAATSAGPWDVVVLDPPYAERTLDLPLDRLRPHLAPGALVVVKHFWRTPMPSGAGLAVTRSRRFGETALTFLEEER
jgi:16S rRNA (guanine(966)-N(2))-methyltransferase RsmD